MSVRHVHADLIIAWAEGVEIECFNRNLNQWILTKFPEWEPERKYRIKTEPRRYWVNVYDSGTIYVYGAKELAAIDIMKDGETIEVVEVIDE